MKQLICAHCGAQFESARKNRYCGTTECNVSRQRAHTAKSSLKHPYIPVPMKAKPCMYCGTEFVGSGLKKHCSSQCKDRWSRKVPPEKRIADKLSELRELASIGSKRCAKCNAIKPLEMFKRIPHRKSGKSPWCKVCIAEDKRRRRTAAGCKPLGTAEEIAARVEARRQDAKQARRRRVWRSLWLASNETAAEQYKRRYREDKEFQLKERMRRQINKAAKRDGVGELIRGSIRRGGQSRTVERLLGYSIDELQTHLQRQFAKGMNWGRFIKGEIHIDHVIPQKAFDLSNEDEWRACWSLPNLQPLWAKDNMKKGARIIKLL